MGDRKLNPDMPSDELRLHMGELTQDEILVARAAIRWANSQISGEWKTIDTAPKDGTNILCLLEGGIFEVLSWDQGENGWVEQWDGYEHYPEFWMPLPDAPTNSKDES